MKSKKFQDLVVWQKAHQFVLTIYKMSAQFPKEEIFGLTAQLRRAAVSISANIAEGFKRRSLKDKARFYNISQGSIEECKYYLILVADLGYSKTNVALSALEEVSKILDGYIKSLLSTDY